jgi:Rrf2 family protein
MLSQKAKYALKALLLLAREPRGLPIHIADIARRESIPQKFLELILLELRKHGLVQSKKGKGGGYFLLKDAREIQYGSVIRIIDGPLAPVPCASETAYMRCRECPDEEACGVRLVMRKVRNATAGILDNTSLADVLRGIPASRRRTRRTRQRR